MEEPPLPTKKTFRSYLFFWSGQLFSILGSSIVQFVLIWWITVYTESTIYLSIAYFVSILPFVLLSPITGVVADKFNRKIVIVIVDSLQALTTLGLIFIFLFGLEGIWVVILLNGLRSVFQAFHTPASSAIIPVMVPKEHLSRINGINYLLTSFIQVIGPVIAAPLLIFFDVNQILWVDVVTFIIALIPLILVTIPSITKKEEEKESPSFFESFSEGLEILKTTKGLLALIIFAAVINFFIMPYETLVSFFVLVTHSGSETEYAFVSAFLQGGIFLGAVIVTVKKDWQRRVFVIMSGVIIECVGMLIIAFAPIGNFPVIYIGSLIYGFNFPIVNTMFLTIIQTQIQPEKQGRIMSIVMAISSIIMPISVILSGPLAEILGTIPLFIIIAVLGIIVTLSFWSFTEIKQLAKEEKAKN